AHFPPLLSSGPCPRGYPRYPEVERDVAGDNLIHPLELLLMKVEMFWSPIPEMAGSKSSRRLAPFSAVSEPKEVGTGNSENRMGSPSTEPATFMWQKLPIIVCKNWLPMARSLPSGKDQNLDFMDHAASRLVPMALFMSSIRDIIESLSLTGMVRCSRVGAARGVVIASSPTLLQLRLILQLIRCMWPILVTNGYRCSMLTESFSPNGQCPN